MGCVTTVFPRPFDYYRAGSVSDAVQALHADPDAKVLAGGQSLVPMLSLGLATPPLLVDINGLDLAGVEDQRDTIRIGALTRHRELERSPIVAALVPLAAEAARHVGNPRVRNRGTFGGSLMHADPSAELVAVAVAHDATITLAGPSGERRVPISEFLRGYYETVADTDELFVHADLRRPPAGSGSAFVEVARRADDFATAGACAVMTLADDHTITAARIVIFGGLAAPQRAADAERACLASPAGDQLNGLVAAAVSAASTPEDDPFVPAHHRRRLLAACAGRAARIAAERAREHASW
jgi:aerobic carbon-monoxide dehydrogenase medium subunit